MKLTTAIHTATICCLALPHIYAFTNPCVSCASLRIFRHSCKTKFLLDSKPPYDADALPVIPSDSSTHRSEPSRPRASKRSMMKFAVPTLGIFLASPLLSNIDNAFVGKTVGSGGLAALSPGTLCTDTLLYLFTFLSRATTGIVARAFAAENEESTTGNVDAAREAASAPLSVALMSGIAMTILYAYHTPNLLELFNVAPSLRKDAASYVYWRGAVTWAALAQNIALSILLATRDATTPLKIVSLTSLVNVVGDYFLCVWPVRWGCAGAAAATSMATLMGCGALTGALKRKRLLPPLRLPSRNQLKDLLEFTGPLLAITLTRLGGLIAMQNTAMALGVQPLAAYQMCINLIVFFFLFGEPLSQLSQTKLPSLIDAHDADGIRATLRSIGVLSAAAVAALGGAAFASVHWGAGIFSSDPVVQALSRRAIPAVVGTVVTAIMSVAVDGALLASRDFGFMLSVGLSTFIIQLGMLRCSHSLSLILGTFTMRLGVYSFLAVLRGALGYGPIGRMLRKHKA